MAKAIVQMNYGDYVMDMADAVKLSEKIGRAHV